MVNGILINDIHYSESLLPGYLKFKLSDPDTPAWEINIYNFVADWLEDDKFIIQKTSGSTGETKEIKLLKNSMIESAKMTNDFFKLKKEDAVLLCLSANYIAGKMMIVRAITGGLNLLTTEPKGIPSVPDRKIKLAAMVPLQLQMLIKRNINLDCIETLLVGGAVTNSFIEKSVQKFKTQVYSSYGMTETCSHIALRKINGSDHDNAFQVLKGIEIETNESGCLIIKAPLLTEKQIQTTDIAEIISPGRFKLLGRADNVINSGGIKILPEELEKEIDEFINHEFVISSLCDTLLGQKLVLIIEGNEEEFNIAELLKSIKSKVGSHRCPKEVIFMHHFPKNANMKIARKIISRIINLNNNP